MAHKMTFVFGAHRVADGTQYELTYAQAIKLAAAMSGTGYVWCKFRNNYIIVGNYSNGRVWNGKVSAVPATADDWQWLARHSM